MEVVIIMIVLEGKSELYASACFKIWRPCAPVQVKRRIRSGALEGSFSLFSHWNLGRTRGKRSQIDGAMHVNPGMITSCFIPAIVPYSVIYVPMEGDQQRHSSLSYGESFH
jgi:hypothetical protein